MLRKLTLASVAVLGLLSPLAAVQADAHEHRADYRREHRSLPTYGVYYRDACNHGWSLGATFRSRSEADRFAASYRCRGFEISIR